MDALLFTLNLPANQEDPVPFLQFNQYLINEEKLIKSFCLAQLARVTGLTTA